MTVEIGGKFPQTMEHANKPCRTTSFSRSTTLVRPTFSSLRICLAKLTVLSSSSPAQNRRRARTVPGQVVTERNEKGQAWYAFGEAIDARRLETPRGKRSVQAAGSDVGVPAGITTISAGTSCIQRATGHS